MKAISAPALCGIISSREFFDVVCNYRCKNTGTYLTYATAVPEEAYELAPAPKDRIVGKDLQAFFFYRPVPADAALTSVEYAFCSDPGGGLPKWALNRALAITTRNYAANMR